MRRLKEKLKWRYKKNSLSNVGEDIVLEIYDANIKSTHININGHNNQVIIDQTAHLKGCRINISGNNNTIQIGGKGLLYSLAINIEDDANSVVVGANTFIAGETNLGVCEGTKIMIGEDCMFSSQIYFATSDSHSVLSLDGHRINAAKDILIGNHCWIGTRVICLKGTELADNCIVGAGSLLSGKYRFENSAYGGNPAQMLKQNVDWCRERI